MRKTRRHARGNAITRKIDSFKRVFAHLSRRRQIALVLWVLGSFLVITTLATTIYFAASLGSKERIMNRNSTGVTLLDRNGQPFYAFYNGHSDTYITLDKIDEDVQKAIISSEDQGFYHHAGFSPKGLVTAVYENLRPGGLDNGGSTITQQLVKNALLTQQRSYIRKYQEIILSIEIERRYSKDEILEMYLNSVYFGEGAFGIEDAAKTYYGKPASDLTLAESSMLVGLVPAPSAYSPVSGDPELAKKRQVYVLERMQQDGKISTGDAETAQNQLLKYATHNEEKLKAPHFALMVKEELEKQYGEEKIARSGYKVRTTLNLDVQGKAEAAVKSQVDKLARSKVTNSAAVAIDPRSGEVTALVGSKDWYNEQFGKVNMATSTRQPGSSFKPIVYATGIENKDFSAATIWHDKLTDFGGGYKPRNYDLRFHGDVTTRRALSNSLNIPAVAAIQKAGVNDTVAQAKKLGLTTLADDTAERYGLSLALGSGQAKLTEMTNAYATLANGGVHNDVHTILSITNKDNKEIFKKKTKTTQAISDETSFIMSSMLSDNAARAETFGSALTLSGGRPAAAKTGTSEDYRDGWTIGYTPSLAVGVWVGNNDNSPMTATGGSVGAAPIWRDVMNKTLTGSTIERFSKPEGVIAQAICRSSGALAQQTNASTITEYFRQGTLPSKSCNEKPKEEPKKVEEEPEQTPQTDTDTQKDTDDTSSDDNTNNGTGTGNNNGTGTGNNNGTGTGTGNGTNQNTTPQGGTTPPSNP